MTIERPPSVSHMNFVAAVTEPWRFVTPTVLHDTTLRDGEQHATVVFDQDDKVAIAELLDEMGVDRIEAGMPAVSQEDRDAMRRIAKRVTRSKVFALVRSRKDDIQMAADSGASGVCIEMVVNDVLASEVFGWSREQALELMLEACEYAASQGLYVNAFMIDTTRARLEWLIEFVTRLNQAGNVDSLTLVDTVGGCSPDAIRWLVRKVRAVWPGPLEIHAHNDFGFGAANTLAALAEGVQAAHVCVNGLGERVGNAPLEQVVTALHYLYGQPPNIDLTMLRQVSNEVERRSGVRRADNQPVTGNNIYMLQSGISVFYFVRVWERHPELFYALPPQAVGQSEPQIVLGKLSGSANVEYHAARLGLAIHPDDMQPVLQKVKQIGTQEKRLVTPEELRGIVEEVAAKAT